MLALAIMSLFIGSCQSGQLVVTPALPEQQEVVYERKKEREREM